VTTSKGILSYTRWSAEDDRLLRDRYPHEPAADIAARLGRKVTSVYQRAAKLGLGKSEAFYASDRSGRVLRGQQRPEIRASQFKPGHESWNKGLKGVCGTHENSRRTQFKKGAMAGAAQHNYVPIGSLRVSKDGYVERKFTDDPSLVPARRWAGVHRLVWEEANGPVPPGYAVTFLAGKRTTDVSLITPEILELVSRQELMRRNSYHTNYPKDVAHLIQLKGALTRKINRRSKP
jgi:hypothetical protein